LKALVHIFLVIVLGFLTGCQQRTVDKKPKDKELLTVDFKQGQSLRYKFVSNRDMSINWNPTKSSSKKGKAKTDTYTHKLSMVVSYTPVEVDPYGLTKIKATCESISVSHTGRRSSTGKDAAETLKGKSFTITITPTGKIEDYSKLKEAILQAGTKAFRKDTSRGRIKEPDMIEDFLSTLWDAVSSIDVKSAAKGVSVGQSWNSQLSAPTSMVLKEARDVVYTLGEIQQSEKGRLAVITSNYQLAKRRTRSWPIPYTGGFQMAGPAGFIRMFFRDLKANDLQGQGKELFNIDKGRIEKSEQEYQMQLGASASPLPGAKPSITIKQKITMQLLE